MSKSTKTFFRNLGHLPRGYTVLLPSGIEQHKVLSPGEGITLSNHEISAFTRELFTAQNQIQVIPLEDQPPKKVEEAPAPPPPAAPGSDDTNAGGGSGTAETGNQGAPATPPDSDALTPPGSLTPPPAGNPLPTLDLAELIKKPQHEVIAFINDEAVTNEIRLEIKALEESGPKKRPKVLAAIEAWLEKGQQGAG